MASVEIDHVVMEGMPEQVNDWSTRGLDVAEEGEVDLTHSAIKGFFDGIYIERSRLVTMTQSVVRDNNNGIHVIGTGDRQTSCRNSQPPTNPPAPFDPKLTHTDIIDNARAGVLMDGARQHLRPDLEIEPG